MKLVDHQKTDVRVSVWVVCQVREALLGGLYVDLCSAVVSEVLQKTPADDPGGDRSERRLKFSGNLVDQCTRRRENYDREPSQNGSGDAEFCNCGLARTRGKRHDRGATRVQESATASFAVVTPKNRPTTPV
jgi:hypothetical protein